MNHRRGLMLTWKWYSPLTFTYVPDLFYHSSIVSNIPAWGLFISVYILHSYVRVETFKSGTKLPSTSMLLYITPQSYLSLLNAEVGPNWLVVLWVIWYIFSMKGTTRWDNCGFAWSALCGCRAQEKSCLLQRQVHKYKAVYSGHSGKATSLLLLAGGGWWPIPIRCAFTMLFSRSSPFGRHA